MTSPAGRWLRWRLHEVRSKVLYCHCRESQLCHGDDGGGTAWRSPTATRGPQSLRSGMGVEEPSLLVPSKKGFGNVEEVQHLLAGGRIPEPSSLPAVARTCAHGEPVSRNCGQATGPFSRKSQNTFQIHHYY